MNTTSATTTDRDGPAGTAAERAMLEGWLAYHRATLAFKCADLSDEQLKQRSVHPSALSLLGLIRHMADVERGWFQRCLAGTEAPPIFYSKDDINGDFDNLPTADVASDFATWEAECEKSRKISAEHSLDDSADSKGETVSLRWILTHMIEEYARHNGHADLLREAIDGATGE